MQALLIDDEIVAVNALKRRVDWSRYHVDQVFTAQSMQEAQEIFRQQKIDFMLCDIEMPNGSGLELFEWVKIYYPLTECVYVTCHPEYKYIRKALKLGSADYILKPIDYEELDEVLCELVKRLDKATENTEKIEKIPDEIMQKLISQNVHTEQNQMIRDAKQFILEHIQETIYVEAIANQVHLNEQYLMRLFKKETGMNLNRYIRVFRMEKAKELLCSTNMKVAQVSEHVGFANVSYFCRSFREYYGSSPESYRKGTGEDEQTS